MPTTRPRRRASRGRTHIAESAGQVIARRGFEETRFADVAEATGASISTLQYLYGSREDLLVAALTHCADKFMAEVRAATDAETEPLERLRATVGSMLAVGVSLADARSDWSVWIEYWRAATRDDKLHKASLRTYDEWVSLVADAIAGCIDSGKSDTSAFTSTVDATELARTTTALIDGYGIQLVLRTDIDIRPFAYEQTMRWLNAAMSASL